VVLAVEAINEQVPLFHKGTGGGVLVEMVHVGIPFMMHDLNVRSPQLVVHHSADGDHCAVSGLQWCATWSGHAWSATSITTM